MKALLLLTIFAITGCAGVAPCADREYSLEVPSTIPFISGAFKIKRSSDHVDCARDPAEREINE